MPWQATGSGSWRPAWMDTYPSRYQRRASPECCPPGQKMRRGTDSPIRTRLKTNTSTALDFGHEKPILWSVGGVRCDAPRGNEGNTAMGSTCAIDPTVTSDKILGMKV